MTFDRNSLPAVDPRISLGSVLSIVAMVVSLALAWTNLAAANAEQRAQLIEIRHELDGRRLDHDTLVQLASDYRWLREQRLGAILVKPEEGKAQ